MLEDNIIYLKKNYPNLYEEIEKTEAKNFQSNISIEHTKNNQETIKIKKDERDFYLHSKYNPLREAEAIISKLEEKESIDDNSHVVFYGLGLGYHIDIFTKRHPNTSFSLYEPSVEVFHKFLEKINFRKLSSDKLEIIQCEFEPKSEDVFLRALINKTNKKFIIMDLPIYENVFEEQYNKFFSKFKELIKSKRENMHINYAYQKRWIVNSMKNLKEVLSTPNIVSEKTGAFKNKTAILAAAGPSLNEEIENLRYIKDNGLAYIFSVGSAINTLIYNGIYPHAACTIDPSVKNQMVHEIIKEKGINEIPMIFGSSVGYETLENYPGNKYHMITSQDAVSLYYLKNNDGSAVNIVHDAPTVAAITLQLLFILGFDKIILVGQNLGYRDKRRYSAGISYINDEISDKELESAVWAKDVYGNDILTTDVFNLMRRQIESYIKQYPSTSVINSTKGGAKIEGAEFIELEEIIKRYLNEKIVEKNWLEVKNIEYDKEYLKNQSANMDKSHRSALKINKEYREILNKIEKTINIRRYTQVQNLYVKLDKELKRIENNSFYKTFILPMNRVQYKILADSIESLNEEKDPYEQGKKVIKSFGNFIDICTNDIKMIEPIYDEMKDSINEFILK
ncbi:MULTISPECIES: motility associated factor glycosyltransferase family protein [unclassified Sedimentibacter]|uniref:motility associated factor glycosyltransferase family protein n=1 Tax=unclassified Sedimentibacter TaxID=2649220 RepID=UPI0027E057BA|nr:6-hydroxymethylpterin diphosphokinase MptE-like protein [Sedimentibacter sp. MB35-C1]WMJ78640.1 DUF115 domain-containing protein [Sedimentibacter sp. MB35-C1]